MSDSIAEAKKLLETRARELDEERKQIVKALESLDGNTAPRKRAGSRLTGRRPSAPG